MYAHATAAPTPCADGSSYCDGFKKTICVNGYWTDAGFSKDCMIIESSKPVLVEGLVGGYIAGQVGSEAAAISTIVEMAPPQTITPYLAVGRLQQLLVVRCLSL